MLKTNHTVAFPAESAETRSLSEKVRARLRTAKQKGQSLVEFALVMPMLLLVVTGIAAFGIYLNNYMASDGCSEHRARVCLRLAGDRPQTRAP